MQNYGNAAAKSRSSRRAVPGLEKYHGTDTFLSEALTLEAKAHVADSVKDGKRSSSTSRTTRCMPVQFRPALFCALRDSGKPPQAQAFATLVEAWTNRSGHARPSRSPRRRGEHAGVFPRRQRLRRATRPPARGRVCRSAPRKKGIALRGGVRVAFIAAWAKPTPNAIQKRLPISIGALQTQQAAVYDMFPSSCAHRRERPANHVVDGARLTSCSPENTTPTREERFLMHYPHSASHGLLHDVCDGA